MAEETKQTQETPEEERKSPQEIARMIFKIILGIVFIALGVLAIIFWWPSLKTVFKGSIGIILILAGAITLAIAKD